MHLTLVCPDGQLPKFSLGRLTATQNAVSILTETDMCTALGRHVVGDWGELDMEDKRANDFALTDGARLLSAYRTAEGIKFWIITEADRSVTTVLLPEDY